ncbi:MAG: F0F1 ATP synthase subunit delta [Burkholderiaceae bacterium]|jgi:F-type H+-transporting ATPase subunit delta|nr:F0F1 ATP synthase subunit delta [Burkholderiaceae bacterium]
MAELATIARPYAEALFDSARGNLAGAQAWLTPLASVGGDARLLAFAANPKVDSGQVFSLIAGLLKDPLPAQGANFLCTVISNGRLAALPEIARQFAEKTSAVQGVNEALIQSAFPMGEAQIAALLPALEKRFGCKLRADVQVAPDLIGGVRVTVGDEVLDTSVKARLAQMQAALAA